MMSFFNELLNILNGGKGTVYGNLRQVKQKLGQGDIAYPSSVLKTLDYRPHLI
jgi:hypothetical protein